uniref:Uncharacterized protein n=1 Tax=Parascaris univalens TaxID=6257 RepID=A0A915BRD3_PARUN
QALRSKHFKISPEVGECNCYDHSPICRAQLLLLISIIRVFIVRVVAVFFLSL